MCQRGSDFSMFQHHTQQVPLKQNIPNLLSTFNLDMSNINKISGSALGCMVLAFITSVLSTVTDYWATVDVTITSKCNPIHGTSFFYEVRNFRFIFSMQYHRKYRRYRTIEGPWPISNPSSVSRDAKQIEIFENSDGILSIQGCLQNRKYRKYQPTKGSCPLPLFRSVPRSYDPRN